MQLAKKKPPIKSMDELSMAEMVYHLHFCGIDTGCAHDHCPYQCRECDRRSMTQGRKQLETDRIAFPETVEFEPPPKKYRVGASKWRGRTTGV